MAQEERQFMLDRYIDGELSDSERLEFESRLAESPELARELSQRRAAMSLLSEWSEANTAVPAQRMTLGSTLRLGLAAAAAVAVVAVPLSLSRSETEKPEVATSTETKLAISDAPGVEVRTDADGAVELVVDPFPLKWRTLRDGVQVIRGKSDEADELLVDPFPEEG